ncbi:DUF3710 domain-containing protein, partial [Pseudonocardia sp.]|uniref:DUF3710 domain-containing protein n=1 Tax=Pseudonocardia sp. TaxID=60912 RepID=UPI003D0D67B5
AGARVRSVQGRWGRELRARTGEAVSVFVGVDGPRWMVYGVATGPAQNARMLDRELRRLLTATVVVRGPAPYPVRTVLPLELPDQMQAERDARAERERIAAEALEAQEAQQAQAAEHAAVEAAVREAAAERAAAERAAAERAAAKRAAAERAAAERAAAQERVLAERAAAERAARRRAAAERAATRRAAAEHAYAEAGRNLGRRAGDAGPAAALPGPGDRFGVPDQPAVPPRSPVPPHSLAVSQDPGPGSAGELAATTFLPAVVGPAPDAPTERFPALPPARPVAWPRTGSAGTGTPGTGTARNGTASVDARAGEVGRSRFAAVGWPEPEDGSDRSAAGRDPFDPRPGDRFGDIGGGQVPQRGGPVDDLDPRSSWATASATDGPDRASEHHGYADPDPDPTEEVRYAQENRAADGPSRPVGRAGQRAASRSHEHADGGVPLEDLLPGDGTAERGSTDGTADPLHRREAPQARTGRRAARRAAELAEFAERAELAAENAWSAARPTFSPPSSPSAPSTTPAGDLSATNDRPQAGAPATGRRAARRATERRAEYADDTGLRSEAAVAYPSTSGEEAPGRRERRAAHRRPATGDAPLGADEGRDRAAGWAEEAHGDDFGGPGEPATSRFVAVPRSDGNGSSSGRHRDPLGGANGGPHAEHRAPHRVDRWAHGDADPHGGGNGTHRARHDGLRAPANGTRRAGVALPRPEASYADTASPGIPDGGSGNNGGNNGGDSGVHNDEDAWPDAPPRRPGEPALAFLDSPLGRAANPKGRHRRPE